MGTNGERRPPRPRIEISAPTASPTEAAAIAAALEQFLADTAPAAAPAAAISRWQAAALREGVDARQLSARTWGAAPGWSST
jgi:hypothetical protein